VNAQKTLLEDSQQSNELFAAQHSDVCREKQQLRQQANEIEYLIRLLTQEITYHERAGYKVQAITAKEREIQAEKDK